VNVSWFLIGLTLGVTAGLLYGWLELRRLERSMVQRVELYTCAGELQKNLLRDVRKPW
jgi:hypothetical protein